MSTNLTKNDNNTVTLSVVIDGEPWAKAQKKALNKASAKMNIKGFRKGRVPAGVVRKMLGKDYLLSLAVDEVAQKALTDLLDEYDEQVELIDRPELNVEEISSDSVTLSFICPVAPEAKLGQWKNLGIEKQTAEAADEDVDLVIDSLLRNASENVLAEDGSEAENGDTVEIDFEGFLEGEAFEGGKGTDYSLVLGSNTFIPGFEDQLVGSKAGEEKEITVTFPEDYPSADLAGKETVFKVKVNDVYKNVKPELNDEFAAKQENYGSPATVDELKTAIRNRILENRQDKLDDEFLTTLFTAVAGNSELEVPEVMIQDEIDQEMKNMDARLRQSGLNLKSYLTAIRQSEQDVRDSMYEAAKSRVVNTLILEAIAKELALDVTEEDIDKALESYSKDMGIELDQIKTMIPRNTLKKSLLLDKATDALVEAQEAAE